MNAKDYMPALYAGHKILPSDIMGGGELGIGNVYWVIHTSKAFYNSFLEDHQTQYSDGSWAVHPDNGSGNGILAAIAACKGGRNDYIIVGTGNYNLTAALNLTGKSSVHLVGLNGGGYDIGSMGAAALTQTGNYPCVIMSPYSEVTGFQMINKNGYSAVTIPANIWRCNIHHNHFHMVMGLDINIVDATAAGAGSYGRIHHNRFTTWVGGVLNAAIAGPTESASSLDICYNEITAISGVTMDYGIFSGSSQGHISFNLISECGGSGAGGGTITVAIYLANEQITCIGNRLVVASGQGFAGSIHADHTFVDNRDAAAGGATPIQT